MKTMNELPYCEKVKKVRRMFEDVANDRKIRDFATIDSSENANISDAVAERFLLSVKKTNGLIRAAKFLDSRTVEFLVKNQAPKKFFDYISKDKLKMIHDLMSTAVPENEIEELVSGFILNMYELYKKNACKIPEHARYSTNVNTADLRHAEKIILGERVQNGAAVELVHYKPTQRASYSEALSGLVLKTLMLEMRNRLDKMIVSEDDKAIQIKEFKSMLVDSVTDVVSNGGGNG